MSWVQDRAEEMMGNHGFLGVPLETFEVGGRAQLVRLLEHGLSPESRVLEIGCGVLRVAYWLVRFLNRGGYCGIEPARTRVDLGRRYLFEDRELENRDARFDHNDQFDTTVFGAQFDYFVAGSIWTHCSKAQIETTLDGFVSETGSGGTFLTSYLPATEPGEDYWGDSWVGTSHRSDEPGIVRHALPWIEKACRQRGLRLTALPGIDCDSQYWLRIDKDPTS